MGLSVKNIHANIGEYQRAYLYKLFWEGPTYPNKTAPDGRSLESVLKAVTGSDKFIRNIDIYNGKAFFPNRKTQEEKIAWAGEFFEVPTVDSSTRDYPYQRGRAQHPCAAAVRTDTAAGSGNQCALFGRDPQGRCDTRGASHAAKFV